MELYMFFNENLVDSICLDAERISQPGYLGQKKRYLLNLHKNLTDDKTEPLFYVHKELASPVNHFQNMVW